MDNFLDNKMSHNESTSKDRCSDMSNLIHFDNSDKLINFVKEYFSKKLNLEDVKVEAGLPQDENSINNRKILSIRDKEKYLYKVVCVQNISDKSTAGTSVGSNMIPVDRWYLAKVIDLAVTNSEENNTSELILISQYAGQKRKSVADAESTIGDIDQNAISKKLKSEDSSTTSGLTELKSQDSTKTSGMVDNISRKVSNIESPSEAGNASSVIMAEIVPSQSLDKNCSVVSDQLTPAHNSSHLKSENQSDNPIKDVELADHKPNNKDSLSLINATNGTHDIPEETTSSVVIKSNNQLPYSEAHGIGTKGNIQSSTSTTTSLEINPQNDKNSEISSKEIKIESENTNKPIKVRISMKKEKKMRPKYCEDIHPYAPLSQVWIETLNNNSTSSKGSSVSNGRRSIYTKLEGVGNGSSTNPPSLDSGGSLLGRKWVWDEGYYFTDGNEYAPSNNNINHRDGMQMLPGRTRRSGGITSLKLSQVISELATGKLNAHTLISTDPYSGGPEHRFANRDIEDKVLMRTLLREFGGMNGIQPFSVCISPDAMFLADLHAHMVDCEIIGLLGGQWDQEERCIYIQAAFPCRALTRNDSGHTDVEMDPVSQVNVQNVIQNHGLKVLGWYHSHPSFQPDPSVVDCENQGNYQKLFHSIDNFNEQTHLPREENCPFVGLIVGTYDPRNLTSRSIIKWFHVIPKETGNVVSQKSVINNSLYINESSQGGPTMERIHFPVELKVSYRCFRHSDPKDDSRENLTVTGRSYRRSSYDRNFKTYLDKKKVEAESRNKNRLQASHLVIPQEKRLKSVTKDFLNPSKIKEDDSEKRESSQNGNSDANVSGGAEIIQGSSEGQDSHTPDTIALNDNLGQSRDSKKEKCNVNDNECASLEKHADTVNDISSYLKKIEQSFSFADGVHWMHTSNVIDYNAGGVSVPLQQIAKEAHQNNEQLHASEKVSESNNIRTIQGPPDYCILNVDGSLDDAFSVVKICDDEHIDLKKSSSTDENNSSTIVDSNINILKSEPPLDHKSLNHKFALPLPFTKKEFNLLVDNTLSLNDEEKATIIWNAVEREQLKNTVSSYNHHVTSTEFGTKSSDWTIKNICESYAFPASSSAILKSFFSPFLNSQGPISENSTAEKNDLYNGVNSPADMVLLDAIDCILSYYSINPHRVDMTDVWNGGSNIVSGSSATSSPINGKIKKGVKLCGSLLRWCQRMQLNNTHLIRYSQQYRTNSNLSSSSSCPLPSKASDDDNEAHIYFITQVMRLLAAKWREGEAQYRKSKMKEKKKKKMNKKNKK